MLFRLYLGHNCLLVPSIQGRGIAQGLTTQILKLVLVQLTFRHLNHRLVYLFLDEKFLP
jgi:hypothetical protein